MCIRDRAYADIVRGDEKLLLAVGIAAGEGYGIALSGTDEVAVCAVRIAAGLGLSTEIGCSSNHIVGNGGVGELIHRLGHFDYGECHARCV